MGQPGIGRGLGGGHGHPARPCAMTAIISCAVVQLCRERFVQRNEKSPYKISLSPEILIPNFHFSTKERVGPIVCSQAITSMQGFA